MNRFCGIFVILHFRTKTHPIPQNPNSYFHPFFNVCHQAQFQKKLMNKTSKVLILSLKMAYLPHFKPEKSKTITFAHSLMSIIIRGRNNELLGIIHPCSYQQSPKTFAHAAGVFNSTRGLETAAHPQEVQGEALIEFKTITFRIIYRNTKWVIFYVKFYSTTAKFMLLLLLWATTCDDIS